MGFNHLKQTNETYFQHFKESINISYKLLKASSFAFIHAFYPDIYQTSASNICRDIIKNVDQRKN